MAETSSGLFLSAPGKIILFGEHAVVYGKTAVAGSIDLRTYVSLFTSQDGRIYLSLPDFGVERTWMLKDLLKTVEKLGDLGAADGFPPSLEIVVPIARRLSGLCDEQSGVQQLAILAFWYLLIGAAHFKKNLPAVKVTVRFKLPSCVGLGSSGAYCVCIAAALLQAAGLIPRPDVQSAHDDSLTWSDSHLDMIRKWSASAESLMHSRASGLDAAVCTYGGIGTFKPNTRMHHYTKLPELKVLLVNSKVERNTSRMVTTVKERIRRFPAIVDGIFDAIDAISNEAMKVLNTPVNESRKTCSEEEHQSLQELCRMNNQLLIALGLGHPKIDQICTTLARYGVHPKMTGAGGGGSVYAFLKPETSQTVIDMMTNELKSMGYEFWQPSLGGCGVLSHSKRPDILSKPKLLDTISVTGGSGKLSDGSMVGPH